MGFFKDIKSTLGSATEAAKNAPAAKQAADANAEALQAGLTPDTVDPNDPVGFESFYATYAAASKAGSIRTLAPAPSAVRSAMPRPCR